jgi:hypothetical protein
MLLARAVTHKSEAVRMKHGTQGQRMAAGPDTSRQAIKWDR